MQIAYSRHQNMALPANNSPLSAYSRAQELFRPEAIAAQKKFYGEVLLIRPLSLALCLWAVFMIGISMLVFLLATHGSVRRDVVNSVSVKEQAGIKEMR